MPDSKVITLREQVGVQRLGPGRYTSLECPTRLGSLSATGFGGNSLAIAVHAAYKETRENFHLYSVSGHFIRPVLTDSKLYCHVENLRNSKSFQTCLIRVTQKLDEGIEKLCVVALADFHVNEPNSMLVYMTSPELFSLPALTVDHQMTQEQHLPPSKHLYRNIDKFIEMQSLVLARQESGEGREESNGEVLRPSPLAIHAERFRVRDSLKGEVEQVSALAFYMDKGLAYIPVLHNGHKLSDAEACATLDFSLRLFEYEFDLQTWHATEQKSFVANHARAYSEGRVWDSQGRLLASMTQQTILRPSSRFSPNL